MKQRVAILTGGASSERDVALASAKNVAAALESKFDVQCFDLPSDLEKFLSERASFDVAIPVFHGKGGEDGQIQGFLKTLDIPFLFSDVAAHALAMDKANTKRVVASAGVRTAPFQTYNVGDEVRFEKACVVKPMDGGSSIGVTIATSDEELRRGLKEAFVYASSVLVEDFVAGAEYTVAVIDDGGMAVALPVIEIRSKNKFFDFESKYDADLVEEICPAPIDAELSSRLQAIAIQVHLLIGARHITRTDFIVDQNGEIWFLEINTIPGQTLNSLVPKAIRASGRDFGELLGKWIEEV